MVKFLTAYVLIFAAGTVYAANCGNDKPVGNADCDKPTPIVPDPRGNSGTNINLTSNNNATSNSTSAATSNSTSNATSAAVSGAVSSSSSNAAGGSSSSISNAYGGTNTAHGGSSSATGGSAIGIGGNVGNTTASGGSVGSVSSSVGNVAGGAASGGSVGNITVGGSTASVGPVSAAGGTAAIGAGAVTNSVSTGSQSVAINTIDPNSLEIAKINAEAAKEVADTSRTIKNTPDVYAPSLTSGEDTCMGSSSGGMSTPGFGVSLGSTWVDENCKRLKNSRQLWNFGLKEAAVALMCKDPESLEALEATGYKCPIQPTQKVQVTTSDPGGN